MTDRDRRKVEDEVRDAMRRLESRSFHANERIETLEAAMKRLDPMKREKPGPSPAPSADDREEALLPCPFCGSRSIRLHDRMHAPEAWVRCRVCLASTEAHGNEATAITDWNRRDGVAAAIATARREERAACRTATCQYCRLGWPEEQVDRVWHHRVPSDYGKTGEVLSCAAAAIHALEES